MTELNSSTDSDAASPLPGEDFTNRLTSIATFCILSMLVVLVVIFGRVVQLQTNPSEDLLNVIPRTDSTKNEIADRGSILDRRGRVLATSRVGYRLFVDPQYVDDPYTVASDLALLLGEDPIALDKKVQARLEKRYVVLVPLLTDHQVETVRTADLKGVGLEPVLVRHRPYGDLAASIVGKVGVEHTGLTGLEAVFNEPLSGTPGRLRYLRDAGRYAMWVEPAGYERPKHGTDVRLSLDIEIQRIAHEELSRQVEAYNAGGGRIVVIDPNTGELLAMCDVLREREGWEPVALDPGRDAEVTRGRMRCVTDPYEPGSTFKSIVWSVLTEDRTADLEEVIDTHNGVYYPPKAGRIRDSHPYEELTWKNVLVKSSNIGMATVAQRTSAERFQRMLREFGFGRPTGLGIPGESPGIVTSAKKWTAYTQTRLSYGHEISVTPLQLVRAFAAFCRDGSLPELHVLADESDAIRASDTVAGAFVEQRPIRESTAMITRRALRQVMTDGTGRAANRDARYRMFGKSGTAQLPNRTEGGYHEDRYVISFIAGAPLDDPRLVILCIIEDPDKSIGHWGGAICGPVVRNIMNRSLEYLGVPSDLGLDDEIALGG